MHTALKSAVAFSSVPACELRGRHLPCVHQLDETLLQDNAQICSQQPMCLSSVGHCRNGYAAEPQGVVLLLRPAALLLDDAGRILLAEVCKILLASHEQL